MIFQQRDEEDRQQIFKHLIQVGAPPIYTKFASKFILEIEPPILNDMQETVEIIVESTLREKLEGDFDKFNAPMDSYRFKDNCEAWHGKFWPIGTRSDGHTILLGINTSNYDNLYMINERTSEEIHLSTNIEEFCKALSLSVFS